MAVRPRFVNDPLPPATSQRSGTAIAPLADESADYLIPRFYQGWQGRWQQGTAWTKPVGMRAAALDEDAFDAGR